MPHSLVVMARAPRLGAVKTRLAATVGDVRALAVYRALVERTMCMARDAGMPTTVCVTPPESVDEMRGWLGDAHGYEPQRGEDLGERMAHAIASRVNAGSDAVVVIGTDCPSISGTLLHSALAALIDADVVFGPATDGGYYLVAMRRIHEELFADVPWSSDRTLAASIANAERLSLRVALLDELRDIDTEEDWRWHLAGEWL